MATDVPQKDHLARLPQELRGRLESRYAPADLLAGAPYDLDADGRYVQGFLVLTPGRLSHFQKSDGQWVAGEIDIRPVRQATLIEGLGMGVLRLLDDQRSIAEWRFTRRHKKAVADLHRHLEKQITGKELPEQEKGGKGGRDERPVRCEKCDRVVPAWSEICPSCLSRRKVLRRLLDFVAPYKASAITGLCLALLVTAAQLVRPYLSKPMFNQGLGLAPGAKPDFTLVVQLVIAMAVLLLIGAVADGFKDRLLAKLGSRVARDIRDKTYQHLHRLSLSFFSKKPTGSLITRITSDSDRIWDFVTFSVVESILSILTIGGVSVILFWLNWRLACFVIIPVPVMIVLMSVFHQRLHRYFHRIFHRWSVMTAVVSDALPGVRVIKAFSQEKREVDRFADKNARVYDGEMDMINTWTLFGPVLGLCSQVGTIIVWLLGGWWVVQEFYQKGAGHGMDGGTLVAFTAYMWMFYGPIHHIAHIDRQFNRAATSVQRIFEVLDTPPTVFSKAGARLASDLRGKIELRNVTFSYDGVRRVLKNINLVIEPGQMIGLAGPSGGGKTTLINLICRFYDVLEGQILIDDVDVRDYDVQDLRRRIGVVLQEPFLFHGTVWENIAYGNPASTRGDVIRAARAAHAHEFIVGFPDGYDTMVGERGQTLSGGERQRISIARAVLHDPRVLILDEATSSVDTESEKLIQQAITELVTSRTTIAIAHRLSTLRRANRLVILEKGQIVEQGSHEELANKDGGTYSKLINMQNEMQSLYAIGQ